MEESILRGRRAPASDDYLVIFVGGRRKTARGLQMRVAVPNCGFSAFAARGNPAVAKAADVLFTEYRKGKMF